MECIREEEIKDEDIIKIFSAEHSKLERAYVQFKQIYQAELCLNVTRSMMKPELQVVLYVPKQFQLRFKALKSECHRLRKRTLPVHKTRIVYTDDDLILLACPINHFRFERQHIHGLPAVNLARLRTPPPGRKFKRVRSDSCSPNEVDKKKERVANDSPAKETTVPEQVEKGSSGQQSSSSDLN